MTITPAQLRTNFPEFASTAIYPDSVVQFWLNVAYGQPTANPPVQGLLNTCRWGSLLDLGAQLYTCHNLVLAKQALDAATRKGTPGLNKGAINSESVGPVSVGFDTVTAAIENAGDYNLTTYGTRYAKMVRKVGAGPVQVNGCF